MATTFTANLGLDKPAVSDTGWGGSRNTNMDDLDAEITKPRILQSALTWAATTTIDLSLARVFTGTNSQVSTIAFSNVPATFPNGAAIPVVACNLILTNGGAFTITWPASVTWLTGSAPILKATGVDRVQLVTRDGGTTWYGSLANGERTALGFRTYSTGADQVVTTGTLTLLNLGDEEFDVGNCFDGTTDRFTIPSNLRADHGIWELRAQIQWDVGATGTRLLQIRKNGTTFVAQHASPGLSASAQMTQACTCLLRNLVVGDYFEVMVTHSQGANLNIIQGFHRTFFEAVHLR